jgi:hypothetical protein
MKKPMKKFKRYQEGGDVAADKQRGLDISNKEKPVGFFERIRMGNIDEPGSEAYNRFGAGRGRATAAPAAAPAAPAAPSMPAASSRALSDDMYSDFGPSADRSSSETIKPTRQVMNKPSLPAKPPTKTPAAPVPSLSNAGPMRGMRSDASSSQYAGPMRGMRSDAGKSPPVVTHGFPIYGEGSAASKIPGQSAKAPQGEKIDSSESSRNVGNALMATGALGLGAAGAYKAKKMYDAAKKLKKSLSTKGVERSGKDFIDGLTTRDMTAKKASSNTQKLKRSGKDFMDGLTVSDMTAKKRGGAVKKYASGGMVSSASKRADGIATKGKTRGKIC